MKYILLAIIILIILCIICYIIKKRRAIRKVKCTTVHEKLNHVNNLLKRFGFEFELKDGIVISKEDPWQRDFGYTNFYDIKAPFLNIVFAAEPIFFEYDNKCYRLELWKGQYGITTGAEMGLYIKETDKFYRSTCDQEKLEMSFILCKNCYLFSRANLTWWLTGFNVGLFSRPRDLTMKVYITLKNEEMTASFIKGLLKAGYNPNQIEVYCNTVSFCFNKPKNYKLNHKFRLVKCIAQFFNRINCAIYMFITRPFNKALDKLALIMYMFPHLYKLIIKITIPRRKHKKCKYKKKDQRTESN